MLEQMERALASEDPRFASTFAQKNFRAPAPKNVWLAIVAIVVGVVGLLAGVMVSQPAIGIVGFVVIVAGIAVAASAFAHRSEQRAAVNKPKAKKQKRTNFMQGLEERWDRRNDGM